MRRGVLYIVWDGRGKGLTGCGQLDYRPLLERSIASVKEHLPGVPIKVVQGDPSAGLLNKSRMGRLTPWESTLYLDADTVVLGDLGYAWRQAEQFKLACCINGCPWLRRYGHKFGDTPEMNTGVLFFTKKAIPLLDRWEELGPSSPPSRFLQGSTLCGLEADDQWAFSKAVEDLGFNPYVLPPGYNWMPGWFVRFFTPLKIWHSVHPVPPGLLERCRRAENGEDLIAFCALGVPDAELRSE